MVKVPSLRISAGISVTIEISKLVATNLSFLCSALSRMLFRTGRLLLRLTAWLASRAALRRSFCSQVRNIFEF